ncbi:zinc finger protein [Methanocalculus chunghsingensis]|uniref:Zinc finger protein n=1 Tax=Methanocalculus chunghsingensis TaxID=156457 RepID=A0A8J7W8N8_9EURY|nr:DUF2180 family protein [Methanocalculus chunghsingensis]MBR1368685.1 zinc finger protein [Methanocalculus chunghsingensis]
MKCYICAEEGKDSDAVAICIVCGMGVCKHHAIREEIEKWEGGYPFPAKKVKTNIPRILCPPCHNALTS